MFAYTAPGQETGHRGLGWSDTPGTNLTKNTIIVIWDMQSGKELKRITGPARRIGKMQFTGDRKLLATIDYDYVSRPENRAKFRLWDVDTGREIGTNVPPLVPFSEMTIGPDDKTVALTLPDNGILLWSIERDSEIRRLSLPPEFTGMSAMLLSANGKWLAVSDNIAGCIIWDVATGERLNRIPTKPRKYAWASSNGMVFSPDSKYFVSCSHDFVVRVWRSSDWNEIRQLQREPELASLVGILADNQTLLLSENQLGVSAWNLATGKKIGAITQDRFLGSLSPDRKTLIQQIGQSFEFVDIATRKVTARAAGPTRPIEHIAIHPKEKHVAVATDQVRVFEMETGRELPFDGPKERAACLAYLSGGELLLAATPYPVPVIKDGRMVLQPPARPLQLLNASNGKLLRAFIGEAGEVESIGIMPDGKTVLTFARVLRIPNGIKRETGLRAWDFANGKQVRQIPFQSINQSSSAIADRIAFSSDYRRCACAGQPIRIAEPESGKVVAALEGPLAFVHSLALSRTGRLAAAGQYNYAMKRPELVVWEIASRKSAFTWPSNQYVNVSLEFSPDERLLATGGSDGVVRVWDLKSGREIKSFSGHDGIVIALAFSGDGKRLISGSTYTTALVWDLSKITSNDIRSAPTSEELAALWEDLLSDNPAKSEPAAYRFLEAPESSLSFIRKHVKDMPKASAKQVAQFIADLDANDFRTRTRAENELARLGVAAKSALEEALKNPSSAEHRKRLTILISRFEAKNVTLPILRQLRCISIAERIGNGDAIGLLQSLTDSDCDAFVVSEARAAMERTKMHRAK